MKVLLVNGSPEKNGCINRALEEVKNELFKNGVDSEIFYIGLSVRPCMACYSCKKIGKCVIGDDSVNKFAQLASEADGFIFGSPVYYSSMSGGLKCFMDRLFVSAGDRLTNKPAACVVSCRRGGATLTFAEINQFFTINNMPVISSQYWNMVHGFTPEDVKKDEEGLQTMRTLADNMAYFLKCQKAGEEKGIAKPVREKKAHTNFIK